MYSGSKQHLNNLKKTRLRAISIKKQCPYCEKWFSICGIKAHKRYCKNKKKCPVCGKLFSGKGITCSHACANTFFRSGSDHPNWKNGGGGYRAICFLHHGKKCIICGEENVVEAHRVDGNRKNDDPKNLIPLCPTHHRYWHSRYRSLIENKVREYIKQRVNNF